jgi:hypothetical protein
VSQSYLQEDSPFPLAIHLCHSLWVELEVSVWTTPMYHYSRPSWIKWTFSWCELDDRSSRRCINSHPWCHAKSLIELLNKIFLWELIMWHSLSVLNETLKSFWNSLCRILRKSSNLIRENSLYAIRNYSSWALCHEKYKFELYARTCIFSCALCHFRYNWLTEL